MFFIRRFEETLLDLFAQGKLHGTTHTYIGQEANAVGVIDHLDPERDVVFSNHRCHGHYLAFTDDAFGLLSEVMGKATGTCGGRAGASTCAAGTSTRTVSSAASSRSPPGSGSRKSEREPVLCRPSFSAMARSAKA